MQIVAMILVGAQVDYRIVASTIDKWLPPHQCEEVPDLEKRTILHAVCDCLGKQRKTFEISEWQPWMEREFDGYARAESGD